MTNRWCVGSSRNSEKVVSTQSDLACQKSRASPVVWWRYNIQPARNATDGVRATVAWLAEHGELVACDYMPLALELHREQHPDHPAIGHVNADAQRLPFADSSLDIVLCVTVLYHAGVVDPQIAVDEMARVVRPGGSSACGSPVGAG